jgi:hypothetical protein
MTVNIISVRMEHNTSLIQSVIQAVISNLNLFDICLATEL